MRSSNGLMATMLLRLACYFDRSEWKTIAETMILKQADTMRRSPAYMCGWGIALLEFMNGYDEISIAGKDAIRLRKEFAKSFLPLTLFAGTDSVSELPLLKGKSALTEAPVIYVCRSYTCQNPVFSVQEAIQQLTTH